MGARFVTCCCFARNHHRLLRQKAAKYHIRTSNEWDH